MSYSNFYLTSHDHPDHQRHDEWKSEEKRESEGDTTPASPDDSPAEIDAMRSFLLRNGIEPVRLRPWGVRAGYYLKEDG